ncbi:hypothetical protein MRB53_033019 [Persea americana]|uniref:Uncharacterized protein n=1 Tax=Persea americana TaxID=3435 RepID=A0ACC2KTC8_PERAE|nr:hypothetical protein MRB53_033019 [Persea americana]
MSVADQTDARLHYKRRGRHPHLSIYSWAGCLLRDYRTAMDPHSRTLSLLLLLLLCSLGPSDAQPNQPANYSTMYLEITRPLPTDYQCPTCSLHVFQIDVNFTVTAGAPVDAGYYSPTSNFSDPWALVGVYSPPANCSGPWSAIVAEFTASVSAMQEKRIAGVWIGGVEILRSSTVQTVGHGAFWKVKKDVSRYASVLSKSNVTAALVLRDAVKANVAGTYGANFTASFHVNVTFFFYGGKVSSVENGLKRRRFGLGGLDVSENVRKLESFGDSQNGVLSENMEERVEAEEEVGEIELKSEEKTQFQLGVFEKVSGESEENVKSGNLLKLPSDGSAGKEDNRLQYENFYRTPADLIIPISKGGNSTASWFVIHNGSDLHSKEIKIPNNTYKAVLEIYVSSHGSEEFWYSNPPKTYLQKENRTALPFNSVYREVFAEIDSLFVGSFVPFPIVYSGGIDPLFWDPIVPIGAFDLPSSDLDLTPFLGFLLNSKSHTLTLGIDGATSFWLIDANLHLWLDHRSSHVTAGLSKYRTPAVEFKKKYKFGTTESKFKLKVEREFKFIGWVNSSMGNLTTKIDHELEFKNTIKIKRGGLFKEVSQKIKTETEVEVEAFSELLLAKVSYETKYPLDLKIETELRGNNTLSTKTEFSHDRDEKSSVILPFGVFFTTLDNRQESEGHTQVQGQAILSGVANTEQQFKHKDQNGCFIRSVVAGAGYLLEDKISNICVQSEEL